MPGLELGGSIKLLRDVDALVDELLQTFKSQHNVLHTSVLLAALSDPLKSMNDMLHTRKGKKQTKRIESLTALEKTVRNALSIMGLMPTAYSKDQVLQKIEERNVARKHKDYEKSDAIRKDLVTLGIAHMDHILDFIV